MADLVLPTAVASKIEKEKLVEFFVETRIDEDNAVIVQDTLQVHGDDIINSIQKVIDTQEEGVRQALIALGWTPPTVN